MKAVVQRVGEASVSVEGKTVASVGPGLLVLIGVAPEDGPGEIAWMARKLPALRIFEDDAGQMNRSLVDVGGSILLVSQFTLFGDCRKGNRPSFISAGPPAMAEACYLELVRQLREQLGEARIGTGVFGAVMQVRLRNDGPVTLLLETPWSLPSVR
jgi:D-tyrosyl-tRNA(Tyr) deacylase